MSDPKFAELLPIAYGNEEETMMLVGVPGVQYQHFREPATFVRKRDEYIPDDLRQANYYKTHLQNGAVVYDGGTRNSKGANLERATAECTTPHQIAAAIQANEKLLVDMTTNYIHDESYTSIPEEARVQRRVVDSEGNTRACHDNFQIKSSTWLTNFPYSIAETVLLAHVGTRSFITGAGYVTPEGLRFGQKIQHTDAINQYGYNSSIYRTVDGVSDGEDDTGMRLEIRCNDINISPWAIKMRLGTSALLLTALQTPLTKDLFNMVPADYNRRDILIFDILKRYNRARVRVDGSLKPTPQLMRGVDYQEQQYELLAGSLNKFVEVDEEYQDLLEEAIQYCLDMRSVLRGDHTIDFLADRADFAAKFKKVIRSVRQGREVGKQRTLTDLVSQMWDQQYDHIRVSPSTLTKARVEYGYGYKLRDKGAFRLSPTAAEVESAYYKPPTTTRAFVRGSLVGRHALQSVTWNAISFLDDDPELGEVDGKTLKMDEVVIPGLKTSLDARRYAKQKMRLS